jgi:hypothetical protein
MGDKGPIHKESLWLDSRGAVEEGRQVEEIIMPSVVCQIRGILGNRRGTAGTQIWPQQTR